MHKGEPASWSSRRRPAPYAISIGHPLDVTRKDADFYPLTVARSYLGEHRTFNGVLMNHLRGKRGLNYGDYAYIENFIQDGWTHLPAAQRHPPPAALRDLAAPGAAPEQPCSRCAAALLRDREADPRGDPRGGIPGHQDLPRQLRRTSGTQDVSRRLGYAIDAVVTGKDLVKELQARLPKMKKADVDRAVRKHLTASGLSIAIVADKGKELADKLLSGGPTPILYDTAGTPPDVVAEDDMIKRLPVPIDDKTVRVVPVDQMFEHAP